MGSAAALPELVTPGQLVEALWFAETDPAKAATVFVDLCAPLPAGEEGARVLRAAATTPHVTIGVSTAALSPASGPLARELTVSLVPQDCADMTPTVGATDPLAAAGELSAIVAARPIAATSLGLLLRQTSALPVWEGLAAESATYSTLLAGPEFAGWLAAAPRREPPPGDDEPLIVRRRGGVLRLTLNRPARRNAYGHAVRDALVSALQIARADPDVTVELDGRGPSFCSGGDLAEFGTAPNPAVAHVIRLQHSAGALLHELAPRTTAWLHGACIGAGVELPAFAGRVVAAPDTQLGLPEVSMGLVPGAGGTVSITRRIGRWRTAWLALTGRRIGVGQALQWRLIDEIAVRSGDGD
jgi:enoyl-CoA hydratase/carnithine racemase